MKINDKNIPMSVVREIKMLLYNGRLTTDEIINQAHPKVKIDYYDVTDINELEV